MPGTFVLSLDTELAWGTLDKDGAHLYRSQLERMRERTAALLNLLQTYNVPATWAFVGHLFLDRCDRVIDGQDPHPDVLAVESSRRGRHWHDPDPATDRDRDPFWYGDDVLEMVLKSSPRHEIGCHTFSHHSLDEARVPAEVARSQLDKCRRLASERGLDLKAFVFPRNQVGHVGILGEMGFTCYRGPEVSWYTSLPHRLAKGAHFLHRMAAITPPVYRDLVARNGVVNIPGSMFLMPPDGIRKYIPGWSRVRQASAGLRSSVERDAVFHLWFHPWNLGSSPRMLDWLERILQQADSLRATNGLRIMTMGDLAAEVLADGQ